MKKNNRNIYVEQSTDFIISEIDKFIDGCPIATIPNRTLRNSVKEYLVSKGGSVRLAALFLLAYSLIDRSWDFSSIPVGIRGKYGDKRLAAELTNRFATFHKSITAFGENLGWKGNVRNFSLDNDPRFSEFISLIKGLDSASRRNLLSYLCEGIADTRIIPKALPKLPANYLTYSKALSLFLNLCCLHSEGHVQQFIIAAILIVHRRRFGVEVATHHPHASDKYDNTFGDIEEFLDDKIVNAYEVTVRDDWKNRLPDLRDKMNQAGLNKYVLIADGIRNDRYLSDPKQLIKFTEKSNFDLAIVDIEDFIRVFCAELKATELRESLNVAYELLVNPTLCGRSEFIQAYKEVVDNWLDG